MNKKIISLALLSALTATCLCGCKVEYESDETVAETTDNNETASVTANIDPGTITVRYTDDTFTSYLTKCKEEYESINDGVTIELDFSDSDNYLVNISNDSTNGTAYPDVYLVGNSSLGIAYLAGLATKLDTDISDSYDDQAIKACSYNGNLVAYPLSFKTTFLAYNSSHVTENKEYTFEDIESYSDDAEFLSSEESAGVEKIFNCNLSDLFLNYGYIGAYVNIGGEYGSDPSEFSICTDNTVKAANNYKALVDYFSVDSATTYESVLEQFERGASVFAILSTDSLTSLDAVEGGTYVYEAFPDYSDTVETAPLSITTGVVVNPYSANLTTASDFAWFVAYTMSDELYNEAGLLPATKSYYTGNSEFKGIYASYLKSDNKNKLQYGEQVYPLIEIALHNIIAGEGAKSELKPVEEYMKKQLEE